MDFFGIDQGLNSNLEPVVKLKEIHVISSKSPVVLTNGFDIIYEFFF